MREESFHRLRAEGRELPVAGLLVGLLTLLLATALPTAAEAKKPANDRLGLKVDSKQGTFGATLLPRREPISLKVRLNGNRIDRKFGYISPNGRRVTLGIDDELRFGKNTITARARYSDGRIAKRSRTFRVSSDDPIVGIKGNTLRGRAGLPVRVRGKVNSKGGEGKNADQPKVRWRVVGAPAGSKPKLVNAKGSNPRLIPDAAGVYRLRFEAASGGFDGNGGDPPRGDVTPIIVQSAEATRAGVFIGQDPQNGGTPTNVHLYGGAAQGTYPLNGSEGPIATLIFDRCSMALLQTVYLPANPDSSAVNGMLQAVSSQQKAMAKSSCTVMAVTAGASYGKAASLATPLNKIAEEPFLGSSTSQPFWMVWIPSPKGTGVQGNTWTNLPYFDGGTGAGTLAGVFVQDASGSYTFRPNTVPAFGSQNAQLNFSMDSSGITVPTANGGPQTYAAGAPGCPGDGLGGFQLLALGASGNGSLEEVQIGTAPGPNGPLTTGDTFWTNACSPADSQIYATALTEVLQSINVGAGDYPTLVFLQGVGKPFSTQSPGPLWDEEIIATAYAIEGLGGSGQAFLENTAAETGPGYSFVGASWPFANGAKSRAQAISSGPGSPAAELNGYLARDRSNRLVASIGNSSGSVQGFDPKAAEALTAISGELDPGNGYQPIPFPNESDPEWQAALQFASQTLNLPFDPVDACYLPAEQNAMGYRDVRALYCGGGQGCDYWTGLGTNLRDTPYPSNLGFSEQTWNDVLNQLTGEPGVKVGEFEMVDKLNCAVGSLQSVYGVPKGDALLDVGEIVDATNAKLKVDDRALLYSQAAEAIVSSFLETMAAFSGFDEVAEDASTGLWLLASAMDLGESVATVAPGTAAITSIPRNTTVDTFAQQLTSQWQAATAAMAFPRDQIASDWQRLQDFYAQGVTLQQSDITQITTPLTLSGYYQVWRGLVAGGFPPVHLGATKSDPANPAPVSVPKYGCLEYDEYGESFTVRPFDRYGPGSYAFDLRSTGQEAYALTHSYLDIAADYNAQSPPKGVMSQIFSPVTANPSATTPPPPVSGKGVVTPLGINQQLFFSSTISESEADGNVIELGESLQGNCPENLP